MAHLIFSKKLLIFACATNLVSAMQQVPTVISHKADRFNGIIIDITTKQDNFAQQLQHSLAKWKTEGKRGVWLTIPTEQCELVPLAVKEGFAYHHANSKKLVLTKWLPENEENKLPSYATRTAGISALVIDKDNRILLVKEKYDNDWGYKMPSGAVEMGENFKDTAVRETKEETGVDTIFEGVLAWWERHNTRMDNVSDLFFVCRLRPLSTQIVAQESEVSEAIWAPLEEFKKIATGPQKQFIAALETEGKDYCAYEAPDFSGEGMMTYYARAGAQIK